MLFLLDPIVSKLKERKRVCFRYYPLTIVVTVWFFQIPVFIYLSRNGSKEVIDDYLDQTKAQVIASEQLLRKMLQYLNLPILPPLQGKL